MANNTQNTTLQTPESDEISLKELVQKLGEWWAYLKTQWWKIALAGFFGGCIGFVYAWTQPVTYTAKITFVVEESKSGGSSLGGLASLAGQFGVDVGGSGGGGLLSGDNIFLYFKSISLSRDVLLSPYDSKLNQSVADKFVEVYRLNESWSKNKNIGFVTFPVAKPGLNYSRSQDSLLNTIVESILNGKFNITRIDKKASFLEISTTFENETLAKIYSDGILQKAIENYIQVKTQRQQKTVDNLEARADSIMHLLSKKTTASASLSTSTATMDVNPLYRTGATIAIENTARDKSILVTMFSEVVKNLEFAKFTLAQETPVIQIIDNSKFPLKKNKTSKLKKGFIFAFLFIISTIALLSLKKIINNLIPT